MQDDRKNVMGLIRALKVGGKCRLSKTESRPSYVRHAASQIGGDTGKKFSVNVKEDAIVVTRKF
ncbi:hypothetical protein OXV64_04705 [Bacteroides fragilis]|uniref:hypothetical protein n=1 Tax=Bacteroides hominis TaxID=2763023 RepID=UPI0022A5F99A|nr:hypothetical protein [Bacteroides fragilis]